jgi:hypothetical protein
MVRPFVSYPVDHHLAQVLERIVLIGAGRLGPVVAEVATFNGDEPLDPSTPPLLRRFGDSWSARGTLLGDRITSLLSGTELTLSYAMVKSPEYREGVGMNQRKLHGGLRVAGDSRAFSRYALLEWAQTTDVDRGRDLYTFSALLGEAAICSARATIALRVERSERPEEERLLDPFRSPRPATDLSILGVTRWTTATAAASVPSVGTLVGAAPFVEVARIGVVRTTAAVFDPSLLYGASAMWRIAAGVRLRIGADHDRMGRYGGAAVPPMTGISMSSRASHHDFTERPMNRCSS